MQLPGGASGKEPACQNRRHKKFGSGRSPGEGNGNPLQYSCLENSMDRSLSVAQSMGPQRVRHGRSNLACPHATKRLVNLLASVRDWKKLKWIYEKLQRNSMSFIQFSQTVTSCKTIVQYHNWNIDIGTIHRFCSDFFHFTCPHFSVLFSSIWLCV